MTAMNIVTVITRSSEFLAKHEVPSPRYETDLLLCHVLQMDRMSLYQNFDKPLSQAELDSLRGLLKRRANREPMAWILGKKGFYEDEFIVTKGVLCPRPDTETLVQTVIDYIPKDDNIVYVADIGCGSGCVGLSIAKARPNVRLFAVDIAPEALDCTKKNTEALGLQNNVAILKGAFLQPIPANRQIDIVVSNPPYIPSNDIDDLEPEVSIHEPRIALDGGLDGLAVYNVLIPKAADRAKKAVAVEVGIGQAEKVAALMKQSGLRNIQIIHDLGKVQRVVFGQI